MESTWRRVLGRTGWAFGGRIALALTGLASSVILARWLDTPTLGLFLTVSSIVTLSATIAPLGLGDTAVRDIAAARVLGRSDQLPRMTLEILGLGALGALLGGGALLAGSARLPGGSSVWLPAACWMALTALYGLVTDIGRGIQDERAMANPGQIAANVAFMAGAIFMIAGGVRADVRTVVWMRAVAASLGAAVVSWGLRGRLAGWAASTEPSNLRPPGFWLSRSWPVLSHKLILGLLAQADILMLGLMRPMAEVAVYGIASRLVSLVAWPLTTVNIALAPTLAELFANRRLDRLEQTARQAAAVSGVPALAGLAVLAAAGPLILNGLFGPAYAPGAMIILVLSLGKLAYVWAGPSGLTLLMSGHQRVLPAVALLTGLLTIGLGIWWGQVRGGLGMAAAVSLGEVLRFAALNGAVRRILGIRTHLSFRKIR